MSGSFPWRQSAGEAAWLLLLASTLSLLGFWLNPRAPAWRWTKPAVEEIDLSPLEKWREAPLWIDARSTASYEQRHIPGAISLNENAWDQSLPVFLAAWQPNSKIVVYCDSLTCDASQSVALRLQRELKLNEIHVLKGGWQTWQQAHPP